MRWASKCDEPRDVAKAMEMKTMEATEVEGGSKQTDVAGMSYRDALVAGVSDGT